MLTCKEIATSLAAGELERSGPRRRLAVWLHLLMCAYCRAYARQMRLLGEVTRRLLGREAADPERLALLEQRLVERCHARGERPDPSHDPG